MADKYQEFMDHRDEYEEMSRSEFTKLARSATWIDGPWRDGFGGGYGEPYMPLPAAWGTLKDGRKVCVPEGVA